MHRFRLAILAAGAALVVVAGSVLALAQPGSPSGPDALASSHEPAGSEAPPSAEDLAHAVDRLAASGLSADAAMLAGLAERHGLGGAVRLVAWSDETGMSIDELVAMRDEGKGWGVIAKELGVHPGLGRIMGNGGGHGRADAPGQVKKTADE